jgi:2-methylcitrate dehydratase
MEGRVKKDDEARSGLPPLGRREVMKIGAGVVMTTLAPAIPARAQRQEPPAPERRQRQAAVRPEGVKPITTRAGYKNPVNRVGGNGPMDETTRRYVSFVHSFNESNLTPPVIAGLNKLMIDALTAWIGSFNSEIGQVCARLAKLSAPTTMKSTIPGYNVVTTPEAAALANCYLVRQADYNDGDPGNGGHASVVIPGVLSIGEAVHATGSQVLQAVAVAYECLNAGQKARRSEGGEGGGEGGGVGWADASEGVATAMGCGKLLGLDEDRLANALSMALVPHLSLGKGDGTQSHFKEGHSAFNIRNGVFAALAAREGMTGPNEPFEGAEGLWERVTGAFDLKIPVVPGHLNVEDFRVKRYAAEGNAQAMLHQAIPEIRQFTKYEDIQSVHIECSFGTLREIASPECWDPTNRETADHSLPYMVAAALMDGEVYLSSYTPQRYLHDQVLRDLMGKITVQANPEYNSPQGRSKLTVKKTSGEVFVKEIFKEIPVTYEEVLAKFDRVCAYQGISNDARDRTKATWTNFMAVKDAADAMTALTRLVPTIPLTGGPIKS